MKYLHPGIRRTMINFISNSSIGALLFLSNIYSIVYDLICYYRIPEPILPHHQLKPAAAGAAALETVPFIIQPGFGGSDYVPQGRLFVKFGTSTGVTTTTSTYFYFLTATCRSTTWFQVCSGLGSNIGGNLG